jgi:intein/homing endonuclease
MYIDLKKPEHSYFFGFIQGDGSFYRQSRNRGRLSIELKDSDRSLLEQFQSLFPTYSSINERMRDTNFKKDSCTSIFRIYDETFRNELINLGLSPGAKSRTVSPPNVDYSKRDYIRGLIDADGSLGVTSKGYPFISLVTASDSTKDAFIQLYEQLTGKTKESNRNTRDNIYNLAVFREDAQIMINALYYNGCLALERKKIKAQEALAWERPNSMKKVDFERKRWTDTEDKYLQSHTIEESIEYLGRTKKSIEIRLWRLKGNLT